MVGATLLTVTAWVLVLLPPSSSETVTEMVRAVALVGPSSSSAKT